MANFTPMGVTATVQNINNFQKNLGLMQGAITGVATAITTFAINAAVQMTKAVVGIGKASIESAIDFESSFAGVRKTVDTTEEEFQKLQDSFRELSRTVPVDVNEINRIAELGGQLGVVDDKTEDVTGTLTSFAETIAALGVSTNLTVDAAATELARFANIMGTTANYGDETYSRLGSTIVDLGNKFATTESDISNFGARIAGAGKIAGLTEANVFAIGAAMSSVGVQAEAGGTAVQKVLLSMNEAVIAGGDNLDIFAGTAGMSAEDFANAWEKDAGKGFELFVAGLGELGDDALGVLDLLGLKDQRLIRSFLSLANAEGLLGRAMDTANVAFENNTALAEEASKRYATTESQIQIFKNTIRDMGITIGTAVLPFLGELLDIVSPIISDLGENLPAFIETRVVPALQSFVTNFSNLIELFRGNLSISDVFSPTVATTIQTVVNWLKIAWAWLQTNIPVALQMAADAWTNILLPAINNVIAVWQGSLLPTLQWLWGIVQTNVIPALTLMWTWLQTNIPIALQTIDTYIREHFLGPLTAAQNIINALFNGGLPAAISVAISWFQLFAQQITDWWFATVSPVLAEFQNWWASVWPYIAAVAGTVWQTLSAIVMTVVAVFTEQVIPTIQAAIDNVTETLAAFGLTWGDVWRVAGQILGGIAAFIGAAILAIIAVITSVISAIANMILFFTEGAQTFAMAFQQVSDAVTTIAGNIAEAFNRIFVEGENILTVISDLWVETWTAVKDFWSGLWTAMLSIITMPLQGILEGIGSFITSFIGFFQTLADTLVGNSIVPDMINDIIKSIFGPDWLQMGKDLISGLIDGVKDKASSLINAVTGVIDGAIGAAKRLLGIESPSKVFEGIGMNTMLGFEKGIADLIPQTQAVMQAAITPMVAAPQVMPSQNINVQVGPNTIGSQIDQAVFEQRVLKVVTGAIP